MFLLFGLFQKKNQDKDLLVPHSTLVKWKRETGNNEYEMLSLLAIEYNKRLQPIKIEAEKIYNEAIVKLEQSIQNKYEYLNQIKSYLNICCDCEIAGTSISVMTDIQITEKQIKHDTEQLNYLNSLKDEDKLTAVPYYNNNVYRLKYLLNNTEIAIRYI